MYLKHCWDLLYWIINGALKFLFLNRWRNRQSVRKGLDDKTTTFSIIQQKLFSASVCLHI